MSNEFQLGLFDAMPEPTTVEENKDTAPTEPVINEESFTKEHRNETKLPTVFSEGYSAELALALQTTLSEGLTQLIAHGEFIPSLGTINPRSGKAEGAIFYVSKRDFEPEMLNETFSELKYAHETYIPFEASFEGNSMIIEADGLYETLGDERFTKVLRTACTFIHQRCIDLTSPNLSDLGIDISRDVAEFKEEVKRQREESKAKETSEDSSLSA